MTQDTNQTHNDADRIFSEYGEMVLLLDADFDVLKEAIKDCKPEQLRTIVNCLQDQVNDMYIEGNEELVKRHMLVIMFAMRQLDGDEKFMLDFLEWEYDQFY